MLLLRCPNFERVTLIYSHQVLVAGDDLVFHDCFNQLECFSKVVFSAGLVEHGIGTINERQQPFASAETKLLVVFRFIVRVVGIPVHRELNFCLEKKMIFFFLICKDIIDTSVTNNKVLLNYLQYRLYEGLQRNLG